MSDPIRARLDEFTERHYLADVTDLAAALRAVGWGTALKPAHEPIVVARKPLIGTVAANVLAHGTGGLNIDGCRVEATGRPLIVSKAEGSTGVFGDGLNGSANGGTTDTGRWPANVILDEAAGAELDKQSGTTSYNPAGVFGRQRGDQPGDTAAAFAVRKDGDGVFGYGDRGGASRFFLTVRDDEDETCDCAVTAAPSSTLDAHRPSSVPEAAATRAALAPRPSSGYLAPSTSATPSESGNVCDPTTPTPTAASGHSPALLHAAHIPSCSHARPAGPHEPTGITTTTTAPSTSDGCAGPATSATTQTTSELGDRGLGGARFRYCPKADTDERPRVNGEAHATVKPLDLMRWLIRLVTPPGGLVLDPFAGSGTTAEAAIIEGFRCTIVELTPAHLPLILARITKPLQPVLDFGAMA